MYCMYLRHSETLCSEVPYTQSYFPLAHHKSQRYLQWHRVSQCPSSFNHPVPQRLLYCSILRENCTICTSIHGKRTSGACIVWNMIFRTLLSGIARTSCRQINFLEPANWSKCREDTTEQGFLQTMGYRCKFNQIHGHYKIDKTHDQLWHFGILMDPGYSISRQIHIPYILKPSLDQSCLDPKTARSYGPSPPIVVGSKPLKILYSDMTTVEISLNAVFNENQSGWFIARLN